MVATVQQRAASAVAAHFTWFDLMSTDQAASLSFFRAVLGWTVADDELGPYTTVMAGGEPCGGMVQLSPGEGHPSHFVAYIGCDDVDELVARAPGLGGTVAYAPVDVSGVGRIALLTDPLGATVAVMTAAPDAATVGAASVPLGGVAWRELISERPGRSGVFYARLCGWSLKDVSTEMGEYTVLGADDAAVGGVARSSLDDLFAAWLHYFLVADLDDAVALIAEHGGRIRSAITTIPHDCRFALASDPTGATFALLQHLG